MGSHALGSFTAGHENAFYIDDSGIYYGVSLGWGGLKHWDFAWAPQPDIAASPGTMQTLAYDASAGQWWAGDANRNLYMYNGISWSYQGTHVALGGGHHDGMEIVDGKLFVSDMTSDVLAMYELDGSVDWANPDELFSYSANPPVEGMGYGPNRHLWVSGWSSGTFYEIGGGRLQQEFEIPEPLTMLCALGAIFALKGYTRKRRRA